MRPQTGKQLRASRHRLVFDELLLLQLKPACNGATNRSAVPPQPWVLPASQGSLVRPSWTLLPFPLTSAQQAGVARSAPDLRQEQAMARLLQGDVGSARRGATRPCSPPSRRVARVR